MGTTNPHVLERVRGIRKQLLAAREAGKAMSRASKGTEREALIAGFLSKVLPPTYRFGTGDATDIAGNRSGQLDVVVEYPFGPSIPIVGPGDVRLYLAETVGVVIEVKSNLSTQWNEVVRTAEQLAPLRRAPNSGMTWGSGPSDRIPLVVVGFEGWKALDSLKRNVDEVDAVTAALSIHENFFYWKGNGHVVGDTALWALIAYLHDTMGSLIAGSGNPLGYMGVD